MQQVIYFFIIFELRIIEMRINVALNKKANQSSTYATLGPQRANDGDRRQHATTNNFCAHSDFDRTDWWAVDIGEEYNIHSITIYNRDDCCSDRLSDYFIYIYRPKFTTWGSFDGKYGTICYQHKGVSPSILNVACNGRIIGRFVQIYKPYKKLWQKQNALCLCEVEVYPDSLTIVPVDTPKRKGQFCKDAKKRFFLGLNIQISGATANKCSALCIATDSCLGFDITGDGVCSLAQASETVTTSNPATTYFEKC